MKREQEELCVLQRDTDTYRQYGKVLRDRLNAIVAGWRGRDWVLDIERAFIRNEPCYIKTPSLEYYRSDYGDGKIEENLFSALFDMEHVEDQDTTEGRRKVDLINHQRLFRFQSKRSRNFTLWLTVGSGDLSLPPSQNFVDVTHFIVHIWEMDTPDSWYWVVVPNAFFDVWFQNLRSGSGRGKRLPFVPKTKNPAFFKLQQDITEDREKELNVIDSGRDSVQL